MRERLAEGYYQPDQKMVVTIWVATDVRSPPGGFEESDPRIMPEEKWARFCDHIDHGYEEGELENAQAELLDAWMDEWDPEPDEEDEDDEQA